MTTAPDDEPSTGTRGSSLMPVGKSPVPDRLYDLNLKRLVEVANERTLRDLGPLPSGGLPIEPKRKAPHLPPAWRQQEADGGTHPHQENPDMKLTPVAAAAALALSGCAQPFVEQYPKTPPPPPLSAQATPTLPPPMTQEVAASAAKVNDMAQRVLRLIDELPSIEDLTRERLEGVVGRKLELVDRGSNSFWTTDADTGLGVYWMIFNEKGLSWDHPHLLFEMKPKGGERTPWTPVCVEFEPFAAALMAKGFNAGPYVGNHGELLGWNFSRFGDRDRRPPAIRVSSEREMPAPALNGRNCIASIELR